MTNQELEFEKKLAIHFAEKKAEMEMRMKAEKEIEKLNEQIKKLKEALLDMVNAGSYMTTQEWALLQLSARQALEELKGVTHE